jgi:cytoskeletal protein CcmA (bactofilin family)
MADKETIIGPETRISGELRGDEDVVVRGRVEGRVVLTSVFTVEESAVVQADVEARIVLVSGVVVGNIAASESIRLAGKARVVGDVTAPRLVMEEGASYRGRLDMGQAAESADQPIGARRTAERDGSSKSHPARLTLPARVAASPGPVAARVATTTTTAAAPPRVATAGPARPASPPPSLQRPDSAASGGVASTPAWAKKKLHRRG